MKYVFSMTLALALLASAPALAEGKIDVMTQNQYLGADLGPIITAGTPEAFNEALVDALETIAANDYLSRATKLAELIADRLPELVGLQEMFQFGCVPLAPPQAGEGCDAPDIRDAFNDHLEETEKALLLLDEPYDVAAIVNNLDLRGVLGIPGYPGPGLPVDITEPRDGRPDIAVTVLDRDVILARPDVPTKKLAGSYTTGGLCGLPILNPLPIGPNPLSSTVSEDGCNYSIVVQQGTAAGITIAIQRGFVGVEATVGDKTYRYVNTHLEVQEPEDGNPASSIIQAAQSYELLATLGNIGSSGSDIVVGDINSSSEDDQILPIPPPYTQFVLAGYTDAWDLRPGAVPGYTCCQADDLSNHQSEHDERIDVIFSKKVPSKVKKARVLGSKVSNKTSPPGQGLWPSDHGSVAAELQF